MIDKKKDWGKGFDIGKMSKEEIAAKFDKHAANWYAVHLLSLVFVHFSAGVSLWKNPSIPQYMTG